MSSKPVLTYFSGRGRAETSRLIFAEAGVDYEDVRVNDHSSLIPSLPFGQLPVLDHNGVRIAQSVAIARYLAKLYGLYGKTAIEGAQADMIVDGFIDLNSSPNKTDEEKAKFQSTALPKWLGHFEKILGSNHEGKGFFVGDSITYADILSFNLLGNYTKANASCLDNTPLLKAHYKRIGDRPNIKAWVEKRPNTPW